MISFLGAQQINSQMKRKLIYRRGLSLSLCVYVSVYSYQVSMAIQARRNPLNKTDAQPHQIAIAATARVLLSLYVSLSGLNGQHSVSTLRLALRIRHRAHYANYAGALFCQPPLLAIKQANWHVPRTNTCIAMQQGSHPLPLLPPLTPLAPLTQRNSFLALGQG